MNRYKKRPILLVLVLLTSACSHTSVTSAWVSPICISHGDILTEGTKQQIDTQDETLGKPCKK